MFELVSEQQEEFCKAICGCGEYQFSEDYKFLEVPHTQWLQMTSEQRKVKINKALKYELNGKAACCATSKEVCHDVTRLSIESANANIPHLQPQRIESLWKKAEDILSTPWPYFACSRKQFSSSSCKY